MSVTIFGILNIGFALFGFVSLLASRVMLHAKLPGNSVVMDAAASNSAWSHFVAFFGAAQALVLLAAGIGLLLTQYWARILSIVYSIIAIVYVVISSAVNYPQVQAMLARIPSVPAAMLPAITLVVTVLGLVFGLVYPILLLFFMTRPKVIAALDPETPAGAPPLA
jgi:hypothetical protein